MHDLSKREPGPTPGVSWAGGQDMHMEHVDQSNVPDQSPRVLLTAAEAFPALEALFLEAQTEIWAGFRVFDLTTKLRSDAAKAVGETWYDLIIHTLKRGVAIDITITDFDPVVRSAMHRCTWKTTRMFLAAGELAGADAKLRVRPAMHASETGIVPRLVFLPQIMKKLWRTCGWLNSLDAAQRETALRDMPGLTRWLHRKEDGTYRPYLTKVPRLYPATHHQKLAVFDRQKLYIGGLDLNDRRYDTPEHDRPGEETWHDVQIIVEGPVVAEAQTHLESFLDIVAGRAEPGSPRRFLRTLSRRRKVEGPFFGPEPVVSELATAHELLANRSEQLIYLETQFFRDRKLARKLAAIGREKPDLSMILILPAAPEEVAFEDKDDLDSRYGEFLQARSLRILSKGFGRRLFVGGAAQPRHAGPSKSENGRDQMHGAPLVYIHAKVSTFDDRAAIVSSANLNGRSLKWDTEAGVFLNRADEVRDLRLRIMSHWLPDGASDMYFETTKAVEAWRALAIRNARRAPHEREGFVLPYDLKTAEEFGQALPGVPEEMV